METWTIRRIKASNVARGLNFFEAGTMRFFRSKVEPRVYSGPGGVYFLTSEQGPHADSPRKWTVRRFQPGTGACETVGLFNSLDRIEARVLAQDFATGEAVELAR